MVKLGQIFTDKITSLVSRSLESYSRRFSSTVHILELPSEAEQPKLSLEDALLQVNSKEQTGAVLARDGNSVVAVAATKAELVSFIAGLGYSSKDVEYPVQALSGRSLLGEKIKDLYRKLPTGIAAVIAKQLGGSVTGTNTYVKVQLKGASTKEVSSAVVTNLVSYVNRQEFLKESGLLDKISVDINAALSGVQPNAKLSFARQQKTISPAPKQTRQVQEYKTQQLRTLQGRFTSLASLKTLLNASLTTTIEKNMGSGDSKNILNYRTGRFANSAEVTKLIQGRTGMLTAYYTYMKYPYQTFEPGFAQGIPKSRDPKLLISKSIHQIAATHVANRMRAVLA
jgi:hypothetical protein